VATYLGIEPHLRTKKLRLIGKTTFSRRKDKPGEEYQTRLTLLCAMEILLRILNPIQALLILLWCAICASCGIVLVVLLFSRQRAIFVTSRILWSPVVLLISGVRLKITGRENAPGDRNCIYIANHESLFDIVVLVRAVPVALFFLAKQELSKVPFLGWYMKAVGMILVDRGNREKSKKSMQRAAALINQGRNVVSFPEGTRSKTGEVMMFKRGSFVIAKEGQIDIVPIGISGASKVLANGSFSLRPGVIRVNIGKPIAIRDFPNFSDEELAEFARGEVQKLKGDF
jgi:1-acyl-sn-glycerol-3-phosphate acyltransferase